MIIRRLGQAIARQDWFVVFIELVVLVVGIFIGLQVDDWNQARKDRADERRFLGALHEDVVLAERLSARVRERRLSRRDAVISANDVLFGHAERDSLTAEECITVATSNYFNITVTGFPSLEELIATGRLGIIRDEELRAALMGLRETRAALQTMVGIQSGQSSFTNLPQRFPDLIAVTWRYDAEGDEIRGTATCDLDGMRASQAFLNHWGANADGYDAYVRDGLAPWITKFNHVHALVDERLSLAHGPAGS